jgi:uncharacterized damage-inducible protein DinB
MTLNKQIAKHIRDVYFGGNWTSVNLKDTLTDISWEEATTNVHNFNTIATLVFHINYYVAPVLKVLQGDPLNANDKFSFDLPLITSADDWQKLITKALEEAELLALQIEKLDETKLFKDFTDPKYGNYYRNLHGIIEHTHYHLGQICLIKKILNGIKADK